VCRKSPCVLHHHVSGITDHHRWALLLEQQSSIAVYCLLTKENNIPFSICSKKNGNCHFPYTYIHISIYIYTKNGTIYINMCIYCTSKRKRKTEAQVFFLNLFSVCSSCKLKFFVCPFVNVETNWRYPIANGLNGLARLCRPHANLSRRVW
jgi:hypothetical protein